MLTHDIRGERQQTSQWNISSSVCHWPTQLTCIN